MNALQELGRLLAENHLQDDDIEAATFDFNTGYSANTSQAFNLPMGHTSEQRREFMENINREYDSGYGGQELYGTIWFKGATWAERGEYDGSEWWEYRQRPELPKELT